MKKEHIISQQGKDFVVFAGLLDEAHTNHGLKSIRTALIQAPSPENGNRAIVHATVETERGVFEGIGDADPGNVNRMIAPHLIRMAETRAKARALRDAINVGMVAFEELGGSDEPEQSHSKQASRTQWSPNRSAQTSPQQQQVQRSGGTVTPFPVAETRDQQVNVRNGPPPAKTWADWVAIRQRCEAVGVDPRIDINEDTSVIAIAAAVRRAEDLLAKHQH